MSSAAQSLTIFDFHDNPVRTVTIDGEPWFVGIDVCRCLGIENNRDALARLDADERREVNLNTVGTTDGIRPGNPNAVAINEPGVYRLIFESRKPEAERFKRWVFHEVLPALRKTGHYAFADGEVDRMSERLAIVREARLVGGRAAALAIWSRLGLPPLETPAKPDERPEGIDAYIYDFIEEMTEPDPRGRVRSSALHEAYLEWARLNRAPHIMLGHFGKLMARTGLTKVKSNGSPVYVGLRIKA